MAERLYEENGFGNGVSFSILNRLITGAEIASGRPSNELVMVSHPAQVDMWRGVLLYFLPNNADQAQTAFEYLKQIALGIEVNPIARVKEWITNPAMPRDEIWIETPKGIARLHNLCVF